MKKLNFSFIFQVLILIVALTQYRHPTKVITLMASTAFLDSRRKAYNNAVMALEEDGQYIVNSERKAMKLGKKNIRVAQSYVWSEIPTTPNSSSYVLNVIDQQYNVGNNNLLPEEKRIKQQDVFFTYAIGYFIRVVNLWPGTYYQLMTFPSAIVAGTPPFFFPDPSCLMGLWTSGSLNVTVNGDVLTPGWDLGQHLFIPQTIGNVGGVPSNPYYDQTNPAEDGFAITEPNWIINGGNNNIYTINFPNDYNRIFAGVNAGVTTQVNLVMKWYGFLAQNASSIMNNAPAKS